MRSQIAALLAISVVLSGAAGCRRGEARSPSQGPTDVRILAARSPKPADLSAPFNMLVWSQTGASHAPLAVASQLAASAGGDWIAILPKPVDDLTWQPQFQQRYPGMRIRLGENSTDKHDDSISSCLTAIRAADKKPAWETLDGRILLYFGTDDELAHAHAHPPGSVSGIYLHAHNCAGMLASIADFWKIRIDADPSLLMRRDALIGSRKLGADSEEPRGMMGVISSMTRMGMMGGRMAKPPSDALALTVEEKITSDALVQKVAALMGGECVRQPGGWKISTIADPKKAQAEIDRLKEVIKDKSGTDFIHSTPNPLTGEQTVVVGTLPDEAQQAVESLAALGPPAMPALKEYLIADKASLAQAVLRSLLALATPESTRIALAFGQKLLSDVSSATGTARSAQPLLLSDLVRSLSAAPTDEGAAWLAKASRDARVPGELRFRARMALASSGRLALLMSAPAAAPYQLTEFKLAVDPDGKPATGSDPSAIKPMATCKAKDGSTWAVFTSGRCGDPSDFWLAHGSGKQWSEFLFTGKSFPRDNSPYGIYGMRQPGENSLSIQADDKTITLGPPNGQNDDQAVAKLREQLSDPKLSVEKRRQISRQYAMRQQMQWQRRATQLQETITIDLAAIRLDSDHDGLTDLVEKRLGTDPMKADTDGDGIPDGKDPNPLVARVANLSDRQRIIQAIFTTLYAGEPNRDPIVVVLDRRDWMEFPGAASPVYCLTREEYSKRMSTLSSFRVLQFGGPGPAGSTILSVDGPVAYNESRSRAEVHFWQWNAHSAASSNPWLALYAAQLGSSGTPVDYVALFQRRGNAWRLDSMNLWQAETADTAMGDLMRKQMETGFMQ